LRRPRPFRDLEGFTAALDDPIVAARASEFVSITEPCD